MIKLVTGDCREWLARIKNDSVDCCVTSPPYFGLRDYGCDNQIGLEQSPAEYVQKMVEVFRDVRRVLKPDGTLWLNLGDSYARSPTKGGSGPNGKNEDRWGYGEANKARVKDPSTKQASNRGADLDHIPRHTKVGSSDGEVGRADRPGLRSKDSGLDAKQLLGIPWRVAFALQADGWYLRQDIIWHKPNPMPESVRDRCTKAHEYLFMFSKSEKYFYDNEAVAEPVTASTIARVSQANLANQKGSDRVPGKTNGSMKAVVKKQDGHSRRHAGFNERYFETETKPTLTRNRRSVWTISTKPFKEAHFATFPPDLIRPCILAGCRKGGIVLDPFGGAGTTALVAREEGRKAVLIELNPAYVEIANRRLFPPLQEAAE